MDVLNENEPWVTFCISTYKRPHFLEQQLISLSQQTLPNFNIIICDNDPEASAEKIIKDFNDKRVFYHHNIKNLGMIRSFNNAIEKAETPYIVMLTDDDHVDTNMLLEFKDLIAAHPGYPIYLGCRRSKTSYKQIETVSNENYIYQLLNPKLTKEILWSSCILETKTVKKFGGIPDFDSPHFADHALLVMCGKTGGGVFINKVYGSLSSHDQNFSKNHFDLYYKGCLGFYEFITSNFNENYYKKNNINALEKHLHTWFLNNYFSLKKYFTYKKFNKDILKNIDEFSETVLQLPFMKSATKKFKVLQTFFLIKKPLFLLKYHR